MLPPIPQLLELFERINRDCLANGDQYVEINDRKNIEYYAIQLQNMYDVPDYIAKKGAEKMFILAKRRSQYEH